MKTTPMNLLHVLLGCATPKTFERALVRAQAREHMLQTTWTPGDGELGRLDVHVKGSSAPSYRVKIDFGKRRWSCTCPSVPRYRRQGACCKHVAGVAVAMLRDSTQFPCDEARHWLRTHPDRMHGVDAERLEGIIWHTQVPAGHVRVSCRVNASTPRALGVCLKGSWEVLWMPRQIIVGLRSKRDAHHTYIECAVPQWWFTCHSKELARLVHAA